MIGLTRISRSYPQFTRRLSGCTSTVETVSITDPRYHIPKDSVILSGIQPTGTFHLGNYFGAVKNWSDLQTRISQDGLNSKLLFFIADLHSLTVPQNYQLLEKQRIEAFASIMACGIDPEKSSIYFQSEIQEIAKLQWILSCFCSMGYLNRMTQWKSKANLKNDSQINDSIGKVKLGLFSYPVLMASDVLTFNATHVPVGQDQSQHLELTRELAETFNKTVGVDYFYIPRTLLTPTKKVLSLKNPTKKMSKSDPEKLSKIFITDSEADIRKKFNKATTDSIEGKLSYDPINRPGIANLINILAASSKISVEEASKNVENLNKKELKEIVANSVVGELSEPACKYHELMKNQEKLKQLSSRGAAEAREIASKNLKEISKLVGMGH